MTSPEPPSYSANPDRDLDLDFDLVVEKEPPPDLGLAALSVLVPFILRAEHAAGPWVVAVALVADDRLRALHRDFMGLDTPTDVMTFPAEDDGASARTRGGDIVVSVDRATDQAPDFAHTPAEEIRFLVVHGLLHLCGWDDLTPADRARMLARQTQLLAAFEVACNAGPRP